MLLSVAYPQIWSQKGRKCQSIHLVPPLSFTSEWKHSTFIATVAVQSKSRPLGKLSGGGGGRLRPHMAFCDSIWHQELLQETQQGKAKQRPLSAPLSTSAHLGNLETTFQRASTSWQYQHRMLRHGISRESHCPILTSLKWKATMKTKSWFSVW